MDLTSLTIQYSFVLSVSVYIRNFIIAVCMCMCMLDKFVPEICKNAANKENLICYFCHCVSLVPRL